MCIGCQAKLWPPHRRASGRSGAPEAAAAVSGAEADGGDAEAPAGKSSAAAANETNTYVRGVGWLRKYD